jgi:hypothetical protein
VEVDRLLIQSHRQSWYGDGDEVMRRHNRVAEPFNKIVPVCHVDLLRRDACLLIVKFPFTVGFSSAAAASRSLACARLSFVGSLSLLPSTTQLCHYHLVSHVSSTPLPPTVTHSAQHRVMKIITNHLFSACDSASTAMSKPPAPNTEPPPPPKKTPSSLRHPANQPIGDVTV